MKKEAFLIYFRGDDPNLCACFAEAGGPNGSSGVGGPSSFDECQLALPPPSYEMVLDLKRRELEYQREISEAEQAERLNSARRRIRNLLGKIRNITTRPEEEEVSDPPPLENLMSPQDSYSTTAVAPNGLFTISRENLPPQEFYTQASTSSDPQPSGSSGNAPVSESDISQHFENSSLSLIPEASRRSPEASPVLPSSPPAFTPSAPPAIQVLTPDPQEREEFLLLQHAGTSRPFTGRSVLSRPTTSISTRTLSTPPELVRKTSLPGTVLENDEDKNEDETNEEQPAGGGGILAAS
nr:histone-lysine N-methyltransferase 2D-like [Cherax quadricarinatus]